jgi:flagellar basal-body rod protein FlgB
MFGNDLVTTNLIRGLDISALQQKITANNLANLNTPGYKRYYVSFKEEVDKKGEKPALKRTDPKHFKSTPDIQEPRIQRENQTTHRADGNNVDLDREMLAMVTNQLRYNVLVQQVSERYAQWRYIINEGRR